MTPPKIIPRKAIMNATGLSLERIFRPDPFALFVFGKSQDGRPRVDSIVSGDRAEVKKALEEVLEKWQT